MEWKLPSFKPYKPAEQLHPLVLAYVGDAVYEMFVRQYLTSLPNHRPNHLQKQSTLYVSAKAQSRALEHWMMLLDEEETGVVRRGRNAKSGTVPKNTDVAIYHRSTAFECLIGYLYYKARFARLNELMHAAVRYLSSPRDLQSPRPGPQAADSRRAD